MMQIPTCATPPPDHVALAMTAGAALLVALIAGFFSIFSLLVTKDQKISEFRHEWLTELRKDFALYIAYTAELIGHKKFFSISDYEMFLESAPTLNALNQAQTRIRLRLNKNEVLQKAILSDIGQIEDHLRIRPDTTPEMLTVQSLHLHELASKFESDCQTLISDVWRKIKQGETIYIAGKWLVILVVAVAFVVLIWLIVKAVLLHNV